MSDLKPCHKCFNKPMRLENDNGVYSIICVDVYCDNNDSCSSKTEEAAIYEWNSRHTESLLRTELEKAMRAFGSIEMRGTKLCLREGVVKTDEALIAQQAITSIKETLK